MGFPNLAGADAEKATGVVKLELARARIVRCDGLPGSEVAVTFGGSVGHFRLHRAWRYWVVTGFVPMEMARDLYDDPAGATDVRVCGHCGCPDPAEMAVWLTEDGRRVLPTSERDECRRIVNVNGVLGDSARHVLESSVFSDEPNHWPKAQDYVDGYHIDTELGLRLFADAAADFGMARAALPEHHARLALEPQWRYGGRARLEAATGQRAAPN